ncbi:hypothetical protein G4B88_013145 [Cannabis sativa]|uniref:Uncharacterized protein n=1 Tax=Cannabis sativa TaxID=3483 RepID=A0A7J6I4C4_CANSA|nr:hypothetical protein G4B88_013145 [Cannabis sativa]
MAHRLLRDVEADAWERSDFPIICEQKQIMTRSARFVHDHSQFLDRDRVGMEDARASLDYEYSYGKVRANDTILKLQRTTPYYKRN